MISTDDIIAALRDMAEPKKKCLCKECRELLDKAVADAFNQGFREARRRSINTQL